MHPVEGNPADMLIDVGCRLPDGFAERDDRKDPPALRGDALRALAIRDGARMEHLYLLGHLCETGNRLAVVVLLRIPAGRGNDARRRFLRPLKLDGREAL